MATIIYVVDPDPDERKWIESALPKNVEAVLFMDGGPALRDRASSEPGACLILSAEADGAEALELVRELRRSGSTLPVIVLGPLSAFRTAVELARIDATEFLERPVSVRQLRAAVRRACPGLP
jgi:DNA-binding NtrC family response regulator